MAAYFTYRAPLRLLEWAIASNLWVGLNAAFLTWLHFPQLFDYEGLRYAAALGLGTMAAYLFMRRYRPGAWRQHTYAHRWLGTHPHAVDGLMAGSAVAALFFIYPLLNLARCLSLLAPVGLVLLYPFSLGRWPAVRDIPGLKLLLISGTWTYLAVYLPGQWLAFGLDSMGISLALTALLVAAITIPFDIRDADQDAPTLRTLPQVLGSTNARQVAHFLVFLAQLLVVWQFLVREPRLDLALGWLVGLELGQQLIGYTKSHSGYLAVEGWLEAAPFVLFLSLFVSRYWLGSWYF